MISVFILYALKKKKIILSLEKTHPVTWTFWYFQRCSTLIELSRSVWKHNVLLKAFHASWSSESWLFLEDVELAFCPAPHRGSGGSSCSPTFLLRRPRTTRRKVLEGP